MCRIFQTSYGYIHNVTQKVIDAVLPLRDISVRYPNAHQRGIIKKKIEDEFDFPNCVGFVDGTLFILTQRPHVNGSDYFTRKKNYAVNSLIICDCEMKINAITMGWPGSVHDNRVWKNCKLVQKPEEYFSDKEYLLADSAFKPSNICVPSFKRKRLELIPEVQSIFNTKVAKTRYLNENCIRLLKNRFHKLNSINTLITCEKDMVRINRIIWVCVIFHNLLLGDYVDPEWYNDIDQE